MTTDEIKNIILVQKVDYEFYKQLGKFKVLPLIIDTTEDLSTVKKYKKLEGYDNLYILKVSYLKWHRFKNKSYDSLLFSDGSLADIITPMESFENEIKENGLLIKTSSGLKFLSKESLINKALSEKNEDVNKKESEKVTITSEVVNAKEFSIRRDLHLLPFVVAVTELEFKLMQNSFSDMYKRLSTNSNDKIFMVLNPLGLKKLVINQEIELSGIELLNKDTVSINEIYCDESENDFGGYYIQEDEYLSTEEHALNILRSSGKNIIDDSLDSKELVLKY